MYTSRDKSLPFELLKQVFKNLTFKQDFKTCLLVCKSWQLAVQECFNSDISIKVKKATLGNLLDDLPYFGQNVKAITLSPYGCSYMERNYKLNWKHILRLCPNITSICILISDSISPFLVDLQDPDLILNDLQTIEVKGLVSYSFNIQNLYLQTCIKYRETITSLQLNALKVESTAIRSDKLIELISQFPRLTCLKLSTFNTWNEDDEGIEKSTDFNRLLEGIKRNMLPSIDIKNLFEEAPQLNDVELDKCVITTSNWEDTKEVQITEPVSLIKLTIITDTVTTSTLRYIVALLKTVKYLHLEVRKITAHETITEEEFAAILSDLKACTSSMERFKIVYNYNGEDCYCHRGYVPPVDDNDDYYVSDSYEDSDEYVYEIDTKSYGDWIDDYCHN